MWALCPERGDGIKPFFITAEVAVSTLSKVLVVLLVLLAIAHSAVLLAYLSQQKDWKSLAQLKQDELDNARADQQSERIAQLEELNETLKTEKADAFQKQQEYFNRAAELKRQLANLERKYRDLVEKEQPIVEEAVSPVAGAPEEGRPAPGKIDGVVREKMESFVAISVGSDDGVKQDYIFHIYHPNKLVCKDLHSQNEFHNNLLDNLYKFLQPLSYNLPIRNNQL